MWYHQVRNEISVLKRVSAGHKNIVQLHDFFETTHNLYVSNHLSGIIALRNGVSQLVFDLCTGGELFDRICARGSYFEKYVCPCSGEDSGVDWSRRDGAQIVRTVTSAVKYLHDQGIVHRGTSSRSSPSQPLTGRPDLKPENILFKSKAEDADLMLADFGVSVVKTRRRTRLTAGKLSKVLEEDNFSILTTTCGVSQYTATLFLANRMIDTRLHGREPEETLTCIVLLLTYTTISLRSLRRRVTENPSTSGRLASSRTSHTQARRRY